MVYSTDFYEYDFSSQALKLIFHVFSVHKSNRDSLVELADQKLGLGRRVVFTSAIDLIVQVFDSGHQ